MGNSKEIKWRVEFHKALNNPIRLEIVDFLAEGEQCQCDIFPRFGLAQSTVSSYLTQMVRAGILQIRKDGTRKMYSISDSRIRDMIEMIRNLAGDMTGQ
ncbi:MAG: metalloregulator ArsR/SmtB family transcription factor [Candidatus Thorarchaeota archaeon]